MYMVAFLALRILYVVALVCFVFVPWFLPLLNPFLAMMSSAGYFHARSLLLLSFFFPTVFVPDLFWCNFLYLVTTAGFVADQLIMINNVCDFVSFFVFCFYVVFFLRYRRARYGFCSSFIFWVITVIIGVFAHCAVVFLNVFVLRFLSHTRAETPICAKLPIPVRKLN